MEMRVREKNQPSTSNPPQYVKMQGIRRRGRKGQWEGQWGRWEIAPTADTYTESRISPGFRHGHPEQNQYTVPWSSGRSDRGNSQGAKLNYP